MRRGSLEARAFFCSSSPFCDRPLLIVKSVMFRILHDIVNVEKAEIQERERERNIQQDTLHWHDF